MKDAWVVPWTNRKGGVGKSTAVSNVGVELSKRGLRVALVDTDPQASLTLWHRGRDAAWPFVRSMPSRDLQGWLSKTRKEFDALLVDTPGHDTRTLAEVAVIADLTMIVSQPTVLANAEAVEVRKAFVNAGLPYAIMLSHAPAKMNTRLEAWLKKHAELGEIVDGCLGYRVDFQDAALHGLGVSEFRPDGAAAREVARVTDWLLKRLELMS
jgi:chromosome partitioning protein